MSEEKIAHWLCQENRPFSWRQNFCCVPNVSQGLLGWESDLLICTKSGFLVEVEIKISLSDWKNDKKKKKFLYAADPGLQFTAQARSWKRLRHFWYVAPMKLAERWQEIGLPEWAGVMGIDMNTEKTWESQKTFRESAIFKAAPKLTDLEKAHLARLGTIRLWTRGRGTGQKPEGEGA